MEVTRRGSYGKVRYEVMLECGHVEEVKRTPPAEMMACLQCTGLPRTTPTGMEPDPVVVMQAHEIRVKNSLARKLGVERDAITVHFALSSEPSGATIFLDAEDVERLS